MKGGGYSGHVGERKGDSPHLHPWAQLTSHPHPLLIAPPSPLSSLLPFCTTVFPGRFQYRNAPQRPPTLFTFPPSLPYSPPLSPTPPQCSPGPLPSFCLSLTPSLPSSLPCQLLPSFFPLSLPSFTPFYFLSSFPLSCSAFLPSVSPIFSLFPPSCYPLLLSSQSSP